MMLRKRLGALACALCVAALEPLDVGRLPTLSGEGITSAYDEQVALFYASLAQASYCGKTRALMDWTCTACLRSGVAVRKGSVRTVENTDKMQFRPSFLYAARLEVDRPEDDGCIVAFRGSDTVPHWLMDSEFWRTSFAKVDCRNCFVEDGFYSVWESVREQLVDALADIGCGVNGSTRAVYVTGHSVGAALATFAMFDLSRLGFAVRQSYNFESPRVGTYGWATGFRRQLAMDVPVYRVTHNRDPIPHVPPLLLGYQHIDLEVHYDETGKFTVCDGVQHCPNRFFVPRLEDFKDHCHIPLVGNLCQCDESWTEQQEVSV